MNILLVHQNFPGQFKHIAPVLGASGQHRVVAFTMVKNPPPIVGVQMVSYQPGRGTHAHTHPWVQDFEAKVIRGNVALKAARKMRDEYGFTPDLIFAHHGWGESLFLKDVWPRARMLLYSEWYYPLIGADMGFDPEIQKRGEEQTARLRIKNAHNLLSMEMADAGLSPTHWQRDTHPAWFRDRIQVIHDGIDTAAVKPDANVPPLTLNIPADPDCGIAATQVTLAKGDEIITFINRNLEPYRGYHIFMRALPELLRRRPKARVVIVGGNEVSYGAKPEQGTWKQKFLAEVRDGIDLGRVHFVGKIPYNAFLALMQMTTVHAYLTYPFVLSWSLLEAMSCAAAIVASDTAPVREAITDGETGRLVDFFSPAALTDTLCELLDDPAQRARLGRRARDTVVAHYDLNTRCLPRQLQLLNEVARG
ncbi:glycosyl transferase, group 1 [Acidovorax sp. JS42]|nr:glycosyl transferase, group 1 [Acidovorax sp. JS42]